MDNVFPKRKWMRLRNLCRCSGYEGQLRGILNFLAWKKGKEAAQ